MPSPLLLMLTKKKSRALLGLWLSLGIAAGIIVVVSLAGNIIVIGDKLANVHPWLALGFYLLLLLLLAWVLYIPLRTFMVSSAEPGQLASLDKLHQKGELLADSLGYAKLTRMARQWVFSEVFKRVHSDEAIPDLHEKIAGALRRGEDLRPLICLVLEQQRIITKKIIRRHAMVVFTGTALSQNGNLDALIVISTNFRMINELVRASGYRPSLPKLLKLYAFVLLAALLADQIDDIDFSASFAGVLGKVPGLRIVTNSITDGCINALVTLRVGFVTRRCLLADGLAQNKSELRKYANEAAIKEIPEITKEAFGQAKSKTWSFFCERSSGFINPCHPQNQGEEHGDAPQTTEGGVS